MQFFSLENLPKNLMDADLIQQYKAFLTKMDGQKRVFKGREEESCDKKETAKE